MACRNTSILAHNFRQIRFMYIIISAVGFDGSTWMISVPFQLWQGIQSYNNAAARSLRKRAQGKSW